MQIQGTIANIQADGSFFSNAANAEMYCFVMTVQDPMGQQHIGQIRSKSQNYPLAIGSPIIVDVTQGQHGQVFKRVNPQQQRQPQGKRQQPQGEDVKGKCICQTVCAAITANQIDCKTPADVLYWVKFMMTHQVPQHPNAPQNVSQQGTTVNQAPVQEDQIPFGQQQNMGCNDPGPQDPIPY